MKKILIVEDNELNMKLFFDILQFQKYEPIKTYSAEEAYELLKKESFDLMILDVKLPKMSGFDLLEKLQNEKISIPQTIIASACAMDEDKKKALEYNIDTYITKPIDINGFVKIVKEKLSV